MGNVNRYNLLLAPAERADVVIDFAGKAGKTVQVLYSDAPASFPGGDIRNDYFYGMTNLTSIGGSAGAGRRGHGYQHPYPDDDHAVRPAPRIPCRLRHGYNQIKAALASALPN